MGLRSMQEVEEWVRREGVPALRKAVAERRFDGSSEKLARAWLDAHDLAAREKAEQERHASQRDLDERSARAAERSADAAEASADASKRANRIAWLALFVALAALVVTAWPHITSAS